MENIMVTRSSLPPIEDYISEIQDIWKTHWLTNMGPKHHELQESLKEYIGGSKIDLLTNGHMALELSIQALGLKGEIITTPFTFASTTHAIVRNGCTPVFCDIKENDYTIDERMIEQLITDRTVAILPVHVYGNVCNVEAIASIAEKYGLKVVYDAAHSFGEKYKGRLIGEFGDVSCFSFHATKVFNTIEGGAVCYQNDEFGREIYYLKNFGIKGPEDVEAVGANAKMNEFCAAMGICNLRYISSEIEKRKKIVDRYRERLSKIKGIKICEERSDIQYNYSYFPIVVEENIFGVSRDKVLEILAEYGINGRKYFYPLTSEFKCFEGKYDASLTPIALKISKRIMTLPLYSDLPMAVVEKICDIIMSIV